MELGGRRRGRGVQPHFPGNRRPGLSDFVRHLFVLLQHVRRGFICRGAIGAGVVPRPWCRPTGKDVHGESDGVECVGSHLRDHQPVVDDHERKQPEQHLHVPELRRGVSGGEPNAAHLAVEHPAVHHDPADPVYRKAGCVRGHRKHDVDRSWRCRCRRTDRNCGMGRNAGRSGQCWRWRRRRRWRWRRRHS